MCHSDVATSTTKRHGKHCSRNALTVLVSHERRESGLGALWVVLPMHIRTTCDATGLLVTSRTRRRTIMLPYAFETVWVAYHVCFWVLCTELGIYTACRKYRAISFTRMEKQDWGVLFINFRRSYIKKDNAIYDDLAKSDL